VNAREFLRAESAEAGQGVLVGCALSLFVVVALVLILIRLAKGPPVHDGIDAD
jgi:hypothetical protein